MLEPAAQVMSDAVERLSSGGLVAFPTETVYGLGADALNADAVAKVFSIKGRPSRNPLIVHVADVTMARSVTASWSPQAERLASRFWPGPLTIVVPKAAHVPDLVTAGGPNVAVRCPDHPMALELLRRFGKPLVGPSANPSGRVSPTAAAHVRSYFAPQQVLVLDGGACRAGIESTVVSLADPTRPRLLRPGVIGVEAIAEVLDTKVLGPEEGTELVSGHAGPLEGPGMLPSHYAPNTLASMASVKEINEAIRRPLPRVAVLAISPFFEGAPGHLVIEMGDDAPTYARNLYAALMRADASGSHRILIESPPTGNSDPIWIAILDRLRRATSPRDRA
jgi:L-threonylcarbamoyladenylate synthase